MRLERNRPVRARIGKVRVEGLWAERTRAEKARFVRREVDWTRGKWQREGRKAQLRERKRERQGKPRPVVKIGKGLVVTNL